MKELYLDAIQRKARIYYNRHKDEGITKEDAVVFILEMYEHIDELYDITEYEYNDLIRFI